MYKRSFLKGILPSLALLVWGKESKAKETVKNVGYVYDWGNGTSTDPEFKDGPKYGGDTVNHVLLNGINVSRLYIRSIRTGEDGYIIFMVVDKDGKRMTDNGKGEAMWATLTGHVEYRYLGK